MYSLSFGWKKIFKYWKQIVVLICSFTLYYYYIIIQIKLCEPTSIINKPFFSLNPSTKFKNLYFTQQTYLYAKYTLYICLKSENPSLLSDRKFFNGSLKKIKKHRNLFYCKFNEMNVSVNSHTCNNEQLKQFEIISDLRIVKHN